MHATLTWVVVANSTEAKIFKMIKFPHLEEVACFIHPESHMHNQDLASSKPGRTFQSTNTARSAYEPKTSPKEVEIEKFARTLCEELNTAHQKGVFSRLYLFAEPSFLGLIRHHIDAQVKACIVADAPKDLTKHKTADVERAIEGLTV